MTVSCITFLLLSVMIPISSFTVDAAPAKHTPAPNNLVKSMALYPFSFRLKPWTRVPQTVANKNEPFLWKSWPVPKTLKADFDFSEKFRVVFKTSDSKTVQEEEEEEEEVLPATKTGTNNEKKEAIKKRLDDLFELLANNTKAKRAATITATSPVPVSKVVVQDRQFRMKRTLVVNLTLPSFISMPWPWLQSLVS
ncbi:hypothetical protein BGX34_004080 [Mortierella sp. NVP85]|nr:hypothetical protein BGX34_004080 [Mortierella sp. NVP85]